MDADAALASGHDALVRADWQAARQAFTTSIALHPTAPAFEGLGQAYWWLDDQSGVIEAREQAFRLYREAGEVRNAGRLATLVGQDYADYRGELAVCNGWFQRAEDLLKNEPPCEEQGWLLIYQGVVRLLYDDDLPGTTERLDRLEGLLPVLKNIDLDMMTKGLRGLLAIRKGDIAAGLRLFDEAMTAALHGEMTDLAAVGNLSCTLIYACEAIADYDRARQWCEQTRVFCKRMGMDTVFSICRTHYATTLVWRGEWEEADHELAAAARELAVNRPGYVQDSLARLGELRRRQGRIPEAEALFAQAQPHHTALFGQAAIALDRGNADKAIDLLSRVRRRLGVEERAERVFVLATLMRARMAAGDLAAPSELIPEIDDIVALLSTKPLIATALAAKAFAAAQRGDPVQAQGMLEDAIDVFEAAGARYEAATTRLELASVLRSQSRDAAAAEQAMNAQTTFRALGANGGAEQAARFLDEMAGERKMPAPSTELPSGITAREAEVLWLLAAGRTNQEIADDLVLSVRTVERHISTIYEKLGLKGRSARASAAAVAVSLRANT